MWGYNHSDELYHYGVKGMKWGVRKKRYVTGFQAKRNATLAAEKARRESIAESRASGEKGIGSFRKANRKALAAKRKAYDESMAKDVATNRRLREEKREKVFNALKKSANSVLDKADRDNFFNSDSIFSEQSMKRQSRIDRARDAINNLDYKTLTSPKGAKHLVDSGKKFLRDSLDDADDRSFFNDDWDTRMNKREKRDIVRRFLDDTD